MGIFIYQTHQAKRKQGGKLKYDEKRISTIKFDTKDCSTLLMRILTGTNALVENRNISQLLDYYQLNQYLCEYLKLLKKQIDTGQSVIFTEMIKYEMVFMLMKMDQSRKVKYA